MTDEPIWNPDDAPPAPPEPVEGACPHCGHVLISGSGSQVALDDCGVCAHCGGLCIRTETGWRALYFDEAEVWDRHAHVKLMRALFRPPLPGPEE